ncbi:uncharacterized protein LOC125776699 isoform X2 [Bactrocera dorsalis]|uniref:Uncharacterized protein LOC125776699 isoform X2 n=1 Tax=Bactrocera dorsalis TaxID=27457 RepID=A0ABM3JAE2_BACDO|nr:uncharacterized protein LOC125776699 isoform X2 [Bactrocera dorsalis]
MPSAQIFYKKLLLETGISADWNLVRWKVRNMRTAYNKAEQWRNGTGAGLLEEQEKLSKMCPHYKRLQSIFFKSKSADSTQYVFQSEDGTTNHGECEIIQQSEYDSGSMFVDEIATTTESEHDNLFYTLPNDIEIATPVSSKRAQNINDNKAVEFAEKMRKSAPKTAISKLSALQSERNELQMQRLELEKEKHRDYMEREEIRISIEKEKFVLEKERHEKMFELEKEKLAIEKENNKDKLKILTMELEMKERLARYELELKYKQ